MSPTYDRDKKKDSLSSKLNTLGVFECVKNYELDESSAQMYMAEWVKNYVCVCVSLYLYLYLSIYLSVCLYVQKCEFDQRNMCGIKYTERES